MKIKKMMMTEVLQNMINSNNLDNIIHYNTYLQEMVNAMITACTPSLLRLKIGQAPSKQIKSKSGRYLDNIVIISNIACMITDDINQNSSSLKDDLKLLMVVFQRSRSDFPLTIDEFEKIIDEFEER